MQTVLADLIGEIILAIRHYVKSTRGVRQSEYITDIELHNKSVFSAADAHLTHSQTFINEYQESGGTVMSQIKGKKNGDSVMLCGILQA